MILRGLGNYNMQKFIYYLVKLVGKLLRKEDRLLRNYFRSNGIKILGETSHIYSNIITAEPWLIEIGDNVTISTEVSFVTHDNSIIKIDKSCPNLYGKIKIGNNCFIGQRALILYGVELANNIIVASGSVVANSFYESNIIIGGNPAKKIGNWDDFYKKNKDYALSRYVAKEKLRQNPSLLVKRATKRTIVTEGDK